MAINLECPKGHKLRVKDELAGKTVRCPKCQAPVRVDQAGASRKQAQESEEFDSASFGETAGKAMRLPQPTRSTRPKKSPVQPNGGGWKIPLMIVAGVLVTAVAILLVIFVGKPAKSPVVNATESTGTRHAPEATGERVASATAENPLAKVKAARPSFAQYLAAATKRVPNAVALAQKPLATATVAAAVKPKRVATGGSLNKPPEAPVVKGVVVWDTVKPGRQKDALDDPAAGGAGWERVAPKAGETYHFRGDCVIENENLRLRAQRAEPGHATLSAKRGAGRQATVPIFIAGHGAKPSGPISISVASLSGDSATVEYGGEDSAGGTRVECHVESGKYWVEVKPLTKADGVVVGVKSQFVVVPSEFGEDLNFDALLCKGSQSIPLPNENLVLALQCDGNFMTVLTYPSIDQAGAVTVGPGAEVQNHGTALKLYATAVSAKFNGKSVFVGVLPQKDNWYYEPVNKKYSASGQYNISWHPPYPGVWRLAGRVNGRYFVRDVSDDNFVFACSQSGTLDCVFSYFNGLTENPPPGTVTPMSIYREMLERTQAGDSLLKTETGDEGRSLMRRKTRYRDVCNSVDDMKDRWRNKRETLASEPDYVGNLLADCKAILERIERRMCEYQDLTEHVSESLAEMKQKEGGKDGAALRTFAAAAQRSQVKLKGIKVITAARGVDAAEKIEQKIHQPRGGSLNLAELDQIAEVMRDVANKQEEELKKLRAITLQLAQVCTKQRKGMPPALKPYVTSIGLHCRKVLRNRDPEE
jgi:hypothetical protein